MYHSRLSRLVATRARGWITLASIRYFRRAPVGIWQYAPQYALDLVEASRFLTYRDKDAGVQG